jgi:hypothetical protein
LQSVSIQSQVDFSSLIQTQNTSTSSAADPVVGSVQGAFTLSSLSQVLSGNPAAQTDPASLAIFTPPFVITFEPPSGITFPLLTATNNQSLNLTDPASLAFYTATPVQTTITPTLTASAIAGASAPNGNLTTQTTTSASAQVTITYTYLPPCPPPPSVVKIVHTGVHHQPTHVVITFQGQVDPTQAENTANYVIVTRGFNGQFGGPGSQTIPLNSAIFDATTNTVTLTPSIHLNIHQQFQITIKIPNLAVCDDGGTDFVTVFGGRGDLAPGQLHVRPAARTPRGALHLTRRLR